MKRSMQLAVAVALLALGAQADAQTGARPPKPPTVVKQPPSTQTKIMGTGGAQGAQKAQGAGSLAPPPPGNAAIKGESAAIKGAGAIKGSSSAKFSDEAPKERSAGAAAKVNKSSFAKQPTGGDDGGGDGGLRAGAIKGNAAIKGNSAIKGEAATKGVPAVQASPRDPAIKGNAAIKGEAALGGAGAR